MRCELVLFSKKNKSSPRSGVFFGFSASGLVFFYFVCFVCFPASQNRRINHIRSSISSRNLHPRPHRAAPQSLFESLVYSGFNFFTAMPILLIGIFDKDVKQQTATECHKLYAVGRLGMDLNMRVSEVK